jgi:hypothetical protein
MKIRIDIDCSPDEARAFFGLPDIRPMQERFMADAEARMRQAFETMDGEALMKTWMPSGVEAFEKMQKAFWSAMGGAQGSQKRGKD